MGNFLEHLFALILIGAMFVGIAFVLAFVIFLFFAGGVWLGGFCGWLLSFTFLGTWVHSALISVGADMSLVHLGALLGFIGSLLNIKLVNPVITGVCSWFIGRVGDKKDD